VLWAHNLLGLILAQRHKIDGPDGAIAELNWVIEHDANFAAAHINLGNVYRGQGRIDDAIAEFRAAIRIDTHLANAHSNLGDILDQLGNVQEAACEFKLAIAELQRIVVSNPRSAIAHDNLGTALKRKRLARSAKCSMANGSLPTTTRLMYSNTTMMKANM
jgi:tetratricopeptide (TPR) repeat protein